MIWEMYYTILIYCTCLKTGKAKPSVELQNHYATTLFSFTSVTIMLRFHPLSRISKNVQRRLEQSKVLSRLKLAYSVSIDVPSTSTLPTKIGFVGLGNMGLPMCQNLIQSRKETSSSLPSKQPWDVMAFDVNSEALEQASLSGAIMASCIEEIASECSIIITMLPDDATVDRVMSKLIMVGPQATFVDCSTVSPSTSRRWNISAGYVGHTWVDAPVSGGVQGAKNATLTFLLGTTEDSTDYQTIKPVLSAMGNTLIPCGGPGTGAAAKLCNNLALAAQMIGICEALNLGEALGVDPTVLTQVLNQSTAKCWSSQINNPHPSVKLNDPTNADASTTPAANDYNGGFGTKLMLKDLSLAVTAANQLGVALPLGTTSKELYQLASLHGLSQKDFGVMLQFLRGKS
jgi:3-hydroxyisobutyrate dehydrogenase